MTTLCENCLKKVFMPAKKCLKKKMQNYMEEVFNDSISPVQ